MRFTFIGDVMLGRMIGSKYKKKAYPLIDEKIVGEITESDYVIANLESPLSVKSKTEGDHLQFAGNPELLKEFSFVNLFSTANNHIADCGELGIDETVQILYNKGFADNGVYKEGYKPVIVEKDGVEFAIVTLTDMLNIPFDNDSKWSVLRLGDKKINNLIETLKSEGKVVIIFAHVGMLFTRYPNPVTRNYLHEYVDNGADLIVTAHSHCLGGMEEYKGKMIFHSLGDFCMDGNSFRRRKAGVLKIDFLNGKFCNWRVIPTEVTDELNITLPSNKQSKALIRSFEDVSKKIQSNSENYRSFFKKAYKREIINHSASTIRFIIHQRGIFGMMKMVAMRTTEVARTLLWMTKDRSNDQRDDDAIRADRKKISQDELFGK